MSTDITVSIPEDPRRGGMEPKQVRVLVVGKTGNGKSSVCNALMGQPTFQTGRSMTSTTTRAQQASLPRNGVHLKVVDTPDIVNADDSSALRVRNEIHQWKVMTSPAPSAILLVIRCDVRYTPEEYEIYVKMKREWGEKDFCRRLVVVFSFGDRQDNDLAEELRHVNKELKNVLQDASNRYVLFNNSAGAPAHPQNQQVTRLLQLMEQTELQGQNAASSVLDLDPREKGLLAGATGSGLCFAALLTADVIGWAVFFLVVLAILVVGAIVVRARRRGV